MKWKVPLYVGIPPARRHAHTAFILHSHLYVFGGRNEEQDFNDLKVMKLINPSERQPVMKEILSEFGLQGVSHSLGFILVFTVNSFTPTKVPNVRYELSELPPSILGNTTVNAQVCVHRDFSAVRDQAMKMIQTAFSLLDQEFHKLDREKSELSKAAVALQKEREAHEAHKQKQQQELQEMLDRHRSQNEAWLHARAEENDRERRELCRLRGRGEAAAGSRRPNPARRRPPAGGGHSCLFQRISAGQCPRCSVVRGLWPPRPPPTHPTTTT
ncbi:unnamed protein product [Menidia menidia]|uniref:(Atlantic silverside) hypothetical protein n=1 Tax=Menidia menidia TaxID=238744 RepID=A0A8S4AF15_9TELE|nr:unnamed protein product [Menidia menidia]